MSYFVNTVDEIGDEALTRSIVDRSIQEFKDNILPIIGPRAFYSCSSLTTVKIASATALQASAMSMCNGLVTADFSAVTSIGSAALYGCRALSALILRAETVASLSSDSLTSTSIKSGTGYIYVPRVLVDSYKSASNWSTYANQFRAIEDYPEICDPYSWDVVAKTIAEGTYKDVYKIGDTVPLDLGSEGVINMQIAAFDTDVLADGSGTAAITWIGKELLTTKRRMNPVLENYVEGTGGIGGWEKSELRAYLQDTVKVLIPVKVASMIQSVTKTQKAYDTGGASITQTTTEDVWIPGRTEIVPPCIYSELLGTVSGRIKNINGKTAAGAWWLRNTPSGAASQGLFEYCNNVGYLRDVAATSSYGICLCFCTGKTPS